MDDIDRGIRAILMLGVSWANLAHRLVVWVQPS
jgi:hypothetical protein